MQHEVLEMVRAIGHATFKLKGQEAVDTWKSWKTRAWPYCWLAKLRNSCTHNKRLISDHHCNANATYALGSVSHCITAQQRSENAGQPETSIDASLKDVM